MAELIRIESDKYFTYYYYRCRQCGKEVRYSQRCIKTEPICRSCQKANAKVRTMKNQIEKENAEVNIVLDTVLDKMKTVREEIDRYGYDEDSIRVYDAIKEIIEMLRRC